MASLHFIGFEGRIEEISPDAKSTCLVLDANLILKLLRYNSGNDVLSEEVHKFLETSKQLSQVAWSLPTPKLAIDPFLGLIELTGQNKRPNIRKFLEIFDELLGGVFGIAGYHPNWVIEVYATAMIAQVGVMPSLEATLHKVYSLICSSDKPSDDEILARCEELLTWILKRHDRLTLIGGPLLYASAFAIAGSPDARHILKVAQALKGDRTATAHNVAWDFLYGLRMSMEFHRNDLENCIVCTFDKALAGFLGSKSHEGPRANLTSESMPQVVPIHGKVTPFKFRRLDNTNLEKQLFTMFLNFYTVLDKVEVDSFKFGPGSLFNGAGDST